MKLPIIRNAHDYAKARARVATLEARERDKTMTAHDREECLALMIALDAYEQRHTEG